MDGILIVLFVVGDARGCRSCPARHRRLLGEPPIEP